MNKNKKHFTTPSAGIAHGLLITLLLIGLPVALIAATDTGNSKEVVFTFIAVLALAVFTVVMLPVISLLGAKAEYYRMLINKDKE